MITEQHLEEIKRQYSLNDHQAVLLTDSFTWAAGSGEQYSFNDQLILAEKLSLTFYNCNADVNFSAFAKVQIGSFLHGVTVATVTGKFHHYLMENIWLNKLECNGLNAGRVVFTINGYRFMT